MKTKILCICAKGLNRSKYLAGYLRRKGYSTRYGGLEKEDNINVKQRLIIQKDIDWADIIIIVRPRLKNIISKKFKVQRKKIIVLDVTDSRKIVIQKNSHLENLSYIEFQKKWTRPQLRKAIKKYIKL